MSSQEIIGLLEQCARKCQALTEILCKEKQALIQFEMEELLENNVAKNQALRALVEQRRELKDSLKKHWGVEKVSEARAICPEDQREQSTKHISWESDWEDVLKKCRENQAFIETSLNHLQMFGDHLKACFGQKDLYSAAGGRKEIVREGSVVEAEL